MARIGETLTNARVRRGLSIDQAAQDTRIAARFIEALEAEDFGALPAPVYVRGFLRSYAAYLKIDPASLLSQLPADRGPRVAGPDGFVGGPTPSRDAPQRGADPFRRLSAPPPAQPPQYSDDDDYDDEDEGEPAPPPPPARREGRPVILTPVPAAERRGVVPPDELYDDDERVRPRLAGVLVGSPDYDEGGSRVLLLAGLGVLVLLVVLAAAVFVTSRGGGDGSSSSLAAPAATDTPQKGTVVVVGSQTGTARATVAGTPTATAPNGSPVATPTATAPGNAASNPTATATATAPSNNPTEAPEATPTATLPADTPTVEPTATPTLAPSPTPTLVPTPTASPTPVIAHPFAFAECPGGDCGPSPFRVVCAPNGWFVDNPNVSGVFDNSAGWPERSVTTAGQATNACG